MASAAALVGAAGHSEGKPLFSDPDCQASMNYLFYAYAGKGIAKSLIKEPDVNACRSGPLPRSGRSSKIPTARQRFRRGACPLTVCRYGKGAQQSLKRCMAASK
ncbi:MAG: hypothetical protein LBE51_06605 [Acidovorax sp.]|jgi:hypothetical protein|nr:hypothetical protein [Acidovorax sp.]